MRLSVFSQILLIAFAVFALALLAIGWFISWPLAGGFAFLAPVLFLVDYTARIIGLTWPFRRWADQIKWHASSRKIVRRKQVDDTESRRDRAKRILKEYEN
jgi:hypothetical protein